MPEIGKDEFVRIRLLGGSGSYILAPVLTTDQRDALTGEEGMVIFNSTTDQLEEYDGATWQAVGQVIMTTHAADADAHHPAISVASGSYVGDGADTRQITTGFQCALVIISAADTTTLGQFIIHSATNYTGYLHTYDATLKHVAQDQSWTRLHASDGFIVDKDYSTAPSANDNLKTYQYVAISVEGG